MIDYTLKPFQKEGVKFLLNHNYSILADGMGLGKTLQSIEVVKRTGLKTLVVCPASLRLTWSKEFEKFSEIKPIIMNTSSSYSSWDVAIVSYAALKKCKSLWREADLVICDEFHFVKNLEAGRTITLHEYLMDHPPERFIGLTGTAIKNRVPEFFSLLAALSYNPYNNSGKRLLDFYPDYYKFANHFSNRGEFTVHGRRVVQYSGHRNVEELKSFLPGNYLRRKASEVLDLPPIIRKDILLTDEEIDWEIFKHLEENSSAFATLKVNSATIKVKHTAAYARELLLAGEGPLLIFSDHVAPTVEIARLLSSKFKVRAITGETSMKLREDYKGMFQEGYLDVLVATIGTMSTGHTLTAASNLIFNDLSYVPGDIAQAEKRVHRIGQEKSVVIHRLFWGKMDSFLAKQLDEKITTITEIL